MKDRENGVHVLSSFIDDIASNFLEEPDATVQRRTSKALMSGIVNRQRLRSAGVGTACASETNANMPTFCSNRVFAKALRVPSTHK